MGELQGARSGFLPSQGETARIFSFLSRTLYLLPFSVVSWLELWSRPLYRPPSHLITNDLHDQILA